MINQTNSKYIIGKMDNDEFGIKIFKKFLATKMIAEKFISLISYDDVGVKKVQKKYQTNKTDKAIIDLIFEKGEITLNNMKMVWYHGIDKTTITAEINGTHIYLLEDGTPLGIIIRTNGIKMK